MASSSTIRPQKLKKKMASLYPHDNVCKYYSKFKEFREQGILCDVTIEIEEKSFQCHRIVLAAASEYFYAMFNSNFQESTSTNIRLHDIDATGFEQVIKLFYTGDATINDDNIYSVLCASDILNIIDLQNLCIKYIEKNIPLAHAIDIYLFACLRKNMVIIHILSEYMIEHLDELSRNDKFCNIPYEDFNRLIKEYWYFSGKDFLVLETIIQWVQHDLEDRRKYFSELVEVVDFESISSQYTKVFCMQMMGIDDETEKSDQLSDTCVPKNQLSLYVQMKGYSNDHDFRLRKIFCTDKCNGKWNTFASQETNTVLCQNIVVDDRVYRLEFAMHGGGDLSRPNPREFINLFSYTSLAETTAPLTEATVLEPPPTFLHDFSLSNVNNILYIYEGDISGKLRWRRTQLNSFFDEEEIARCFYTYYCELDRWYPAQALKRKLSGASMTANGDVVYLVGGKGSDFKVPEGYAQALDTRTSRWLELPKSNFKHECSSCCFHKGKMYVYSIITGMEVYDPVAGKWEILERIPGGAPKETPKLVSYKDSLYAIFSTKDELIIKRYNEVVKKWNNLPSFVLTDTELTFVEDAFVFKYLGK